MPATAALDARDRVASLLSKHSSSILMANRDAVQEKLFSLASGGPEALHIVADFDMTLTKYWVPGPADGKLQRNVSSHGLVMRSSAMTDELRRRTDDLYRLFYPIEVSHTVPQAEKVAAMEEWWIKAHEIIMESRMKKSDIVEMVRGTVVQFRGGTDRLMDLVEQLRIPMLVFSAGLANVIEEILRQHDLLPPHLHIVSNQMLFSEDGTVCGFAEPLIHVFNKSEAVLPDTMDVETRPNVLLLGDSLGDLHMSDGLKSTHVELTLGFLNHDEDRLRQQYLDAFDIVLVGDPPMDFVTDLLEMVSA
ncbi:pyrimidine 5'-nucleotidase [Hyaloraphidium curvatum]|nr:pyrimidine 5'-nucleotidase [Hyaloraphidium curvatum]